MFPRLKYIIAAFSAFILTGCAAHGPAGVTPLPRDLQSARWIDGPTSDIRTLLLAPAPVGLVDAPAIPEAQLSIGAFFTRWESDQGTLDQLALLVELVGDRPMDLISFEPELLLDVDGVIFQRAPGISGNSISRDQTPEGPRARMVIPLNRRELAAIIQGEYVRGRVGMWGSFIFSREVRERLIDVLREMPADAKVDGPNTRPESQIRTYRGVALASRGGTP